MKRIFLSILILFASAIFFVGIVNAQQSETVNIYFFYGDGCPHCSSEEIFLTRLESEDSDLIINRYEVWFNTENQQLLSDISSMLNIQAGSVPVTIIGDRLIYGYSSESTTGEQIKTSIEQCKEGMCQDPVGEILGLTKQDNRTDSNIDTSTGPAVEEIEVPVFGTISLKNLSLPLITIIIAALDGFNPCAMWVLLFLISLLLGMENKKRMWLFGIVFIAASAAVYFLFLSAWLNILLIIGFIIWVRILIGVVAIGSGIYQIREFKVNKEGGCKTEKSEKRRNVFEKLKKITQRKSVWIALSGIILLAGAVNLVELMCSAGLPAVYTQILTLTHLPMWQYYLYLLLYILIFMLDDIIIFVIAMVTLNAVGISSKYARWTALVGGIIMLIIGVLLILKPGWLMFA